MERLSLTPFGRQPLSAAVLERTDRHDDVRVPEEVNKWTLLRTLGTARRAFGVSDRDLAVLSALLSFLPDDMLRLDGPLIAFPSNRSLAQRAHGMPESTLRRHLAALVSAGLIQRHDSPNGKRYARRDAQGQISRAFGFDLSPLLLRANEIACRAHEIKAEERERVELRERLVLLLRDARAFLAGHDAEIGQSEALGERLSLLYRALRRRLTLADTEQLFTSARALFHDIQKLIHPQQAEEMSGNTRKNERHYQSSETDTFNEKGKEQAVGKRPNKKQSHSLQEVMDACPTMQIFGGSTQGTWRGLVQNATTAFSLAGIRKDTWLKATETMTDVGAAIAVGFIMEKANGIRKPDAYLHAMVRKARTGKYSADSLIASLLREKEAKVA